jgi:hypothetical protein
MKANALFISILLFFLIGCEDNKDDDNNQPEPGSYLTEFVSLESEKDTLHYMDTTRIIATAIGKDLKYVWQTNSNAPLLPIAGIDSAIYFYADPCVTVGAKQIFCTVSGENDEVMLVDTVVIIE